jgi:peptidoglycan/LPS O-acetylase OafA/YrhL
MLTAPPSKLSATTSGVLDVLRVVAALVVVVFHAEGQWLTDDPALHAALGRASHAAVMVFFVISGYVMAFTTAANNRGPGQYAVARLSRLYTVLVPALLLTAAVEMVVVHTNAALTARYVRDHSALRYLLSALFLNEAGPVSAAPPLNSPLWSLSYEFWYYLLFGVWFFGRKRRWVPWVLLALGLVAVPKIMLLLPVWLFGVGAYYGPKPRVAARRAWLAVAGLGGSMALAAGALPALPLAVGDKPLYLSGQFLTDWLVGLLGALALWALPPGRPVAGQPWVKPLRLVADLSFPVYALHYPLLVLWRAGFGWRPNDRWQLALATAGVVLAAAGAGLLLERQRRHWIRFLKWTGGFIRRNCLGQSARTDGI